MAVSWKELSPVFNPNHYATIASRWAQSPGNSRGYKPRTIAQRFINRHELSAICAEIDSDIATQIKTFAADLIPGTDAYFTHICEITLQNRIASIHKKYIGKLHTDARILKKIIEHLVEFRHEMTMFYLAKEKERKDLLAKIRQHKQEIRELSKEHFIRHFKMLTDNNKAVITEKIAHNFEKTKIGFDKCYVDLKQRMAATETHQDALLNDKKLATAALDERLNDKKNFAEKAVDNKTTLEHLVRVMWERTHFSAVDFTELNIKLAAYEAAFSYFGQHPDKGHNFAMGTTLITESIHELPPKVLMNLFAEHIKK